MKTNNNTNKKGTILLVLLPILAVLLIVALLVGVTGRTKTVYIKPPAIASSDFSGTMLSDYDNLKLRFTTSSSDSPSLIFDFEDVSLSSFDFVVLDLMDSRIHASDLNYSVRFGPAFSMAGLDCYNSCYTDAFGYETICGPYFSHHSDLCDYTFIIDARGINDGALAVYTYQNGEYSYKADFSVTSDISLNEFKILFHGMATTYDVYTISGLYLYGFENADDCTIGDYIADTTLKLTDCKDSMLYTGE